MCKLKGDFSGAFTPWQAIAVKPSVRFCCYNRHCVQSSIPFHHDQTNTATASPGFWDLQSARVFNCKNLKKKSVSTTAASKNVWSGCRKIGPLECAMLSIAAVLICPKSFSNHKWYRWLNTMTDVASQSDVWFDSYGLTKCERTRKNTLYIRKLVTMLVREFFFLIFLIFGPICETDLDRKKKIIQVKSILKIGTRTSDVVIHYERWTN